MLEAMLFTAPTRDPTLLPGPQDLKAGSLAAGLYGETLASEFITGPDLATLCGLTGGTSINPSTEWLKFAYQGKTLYFPRLPIRHGLNWAAFDAVEIAKPGKVVRIRGFNFRVRFITGGNADPATAAGGEWNDLIYPVSSVAGGEWAKYSNAQLGVTSGTGGACYCQEVRASASPNHVYRGYTAVTTFANDVASSNLANYGWRPILEYVPD